MIIVSKTIQASIGNDNKNAHKNAQANTVIMLKGDNEDALLAGQDEYEYNIDNTVVLRDKCGLCGLRGLLKQNFFRAHIPFTLGCKKLLFYQSA